VFVPIRSISIAENITLSGPMLRAQPQLVGPRMYLLKVLAIPFTRNPSGSDEEKKEKEKRKQKNSPRRVRQLLLLH